MPPTRVKRRTFLQAALSQLAWVPLLPHVGCGESSPTAKPGTVVTAYFSLADLAAARQIGGRFLETEAPGASLAEVYQLLGPTIELIERHDSDAEALAALRTAVQADFADRAVLMMDGWTLSRTELHVCALCLAVS
ncbi:MAG: hypothetical protein GEU99_05445 [Luteitalea sp.]|nr:hypothetical protein [Luteitalea sp.]